MCGYLVHLRIRMWTFLELACFCLKPAKDVRRWKSGRCDVLPVVLFVGCAYKRGAVPFWLLGTAVELCNCRLILKGLGSERIKKRLIGVFSAIICWERGLILHSVGVTITSKQGTLFLSVGMESVFRKRKIQSILRIPVFIEAYWRYIFIKRKINLIQNNLFWMWYAYHTCSKVFFSFL